MRKHSGEILAETRADLAGEGAGSLHLAPEVVRVRSQSEGLELDGASHPVRAHQDEVPKIRDQHQTVAVPIAAHLIGSRRQPSIVTNALDLDDATLGNLPRPRTALLNLPCRVKGKVGMAGALIRQFLNAEHLGLERAADRAEKVLQCRIVGTLTGRATRCPNPAEIGEVRLHRCDQLLVGSDHRALPRVGGPAAVKCDPATHEDIRMNRSRRAARRIPIRLSHLVSRLRDGPRAAVRSRHWGDTRVSSRLRRRSEDRVRGRTVVRRPHACGLSCPGGSSVDQPGSLRLRRVANFSILMLSNVSGRLQSEPDRRNPSMSDKTMRVSTEPLARARKALNTLLRTRKLNFLVDHGAVYLDRRVSKLPGGEGLAQLLGHHVAAVNLQGFSKPAEPERTPVGDRQLVDSALLTLVGVLEEAGLRVAEASEDVE